MDTLAYLLIVLPSLTHNDNVKFLQMYLKLKTKHINLQMYSDSLLWHFHQG